MKKKREFHSLEKYDWYCNISIQLKRWAHVFFFPMFTFLSPWMRVTISSFSHFSAMPVVWKIVSVQKWGLKESEAGRCKGRNEMLEVFSCRHNGVRWRITCTHFKGKPPGTFTISLSHIWKCLICACDQYPYLLLLFSH